MNFIFISPNFPKIYSQFVKSLKERGANVLAIGDSPYSEINDELKIYATEYYFIQDMSNFPEMCKAVAYFESKYGHIDFLESNNEFWLEQDAKLREIFHIDTGFYPKDMENIKYKSKMKKCFLDAGCLVARYVMSSNFEETKAFVNEVGYPIFAKPDNGVGAAGTFKIENDEQLRDFYNTDLKTPYIIEEYVEGDLVSFDGVVDLNGEAPLCLEEHFPTPVAEIVNNKLDFFYYAEKDIDPKLEKYGRAAVKAFGITKRNFHLEFFKLTKTKKGLGRKGDFVALEANMRSPGGVTPELICYALDRNYYNIYADVICFNEVREPMPIKSYISISVSRRNNRDYKHNNEEIFNNYHQFIMMYGTYPQAISDAMGDIFFIGRFDTLEEALSFKDYLLER